MKPCKITRRSTLAEHEADPLHGEGEAVTAEHQSSPQLKSVETGKEQTLPLTPPRSSWAQSLPSSATPSNRSANWDPHTWSFPTNLREGTGPLHGEEEAEAAQSQQPLTPPQTQLGTEPEPDVLGHTFQPLRASPWRGGSRNGIQGESGYMPPYLERELPHGIQWRTRAAPRRGGGHYLKERGPAEDRDSEDDSLAGGMTTSSRYIPSAINEYRANTDKPNLIKSTHINKPCRHKQINSALCLL